MTSSPKVYILATCLDQTLIETSLLVFRTLRIGFPSAQVHVQGNALDPVANQRVAQLAGATGCSYLNGQPVAHDVWVERLLQLSPDPFWILDTDIVFWSGVESFAFSGAALSGRYEPAFTEPWSGTSKVSRLHTSLLYFDPELLRRSIRNWLVRWHPKGFPFVPSVELIRQHYVPRASSPPLFYDTCAGLYQALGGLAFTDVQNSAFEHLHCGAYSNRIAAALPGIEDVHRAVVYDTGKARGLREAQEKFYAEHAVT